MKNLEIITNPNVNLVFENYPKAVKSKMLNLREMVIETAKEIEGLDVLEETLKWGGTKQFNKIREHFENGLERYKLITF